MSNESYDLIYNKTLEGNGINTYKGKRRHHNLENQSFIVKEEKEPNEGVKLPRVRTI